MIQTIFAITIADFRERTRRPAFLVVLLAMVAIAYLAVPDPDSLWHVFQAGDYRGIYNSAWVGTITALAGSVWLSLAGFFVVRGAISRDEHTGVGEILATTPMSRPVYLAGKFLSNLLIMLSMSGVLAIAAVAVQLWRGETYSIDPLVIMTPIIVFTIPVLSITAALAVLFETVPLLRSGFGNIFWVFAWMFGMVGAQTTNIGIDVLGLGLVTDSMRAEIAATVTDPGLIEFGVGFVERESAPTTFVWTGAAIGLGFVMERAAMLVGALGIAVLGSVWFHRFDITRETWRTTPQAPEETHPANAQPAPYEPSSLQRPTSPATTARSGSRWVRVAFAEFRVLRSGASWWWWSIIVGLNAIALFVEFEQVQAVMLPLVWGLPVLIWSRIGTKEREHDVLDLLMASPFRTGRVFAALSSGMILAAVVSVVPVMRMAASGDLAGVVSWAIGMMFISSLALVLGTVSGSPRTFQVIYILLWYAVLNGAAEIDFMGAVRDSAGGIAGPGPLVFLPLSLILIGVATAIAEFHHARR